MPALDKKTALTFPQYTQRVKDFVQWLESTSFDFTGDEERRIYEHDLRVLKVLTRGWDHFLTADGLIDLSTKGKELRTCCDNNLFSSGKEYPRIVGPATFQIAQKYLEDILLVSKGLHADDIFMKKIGMLGRGAYQVFGKTQMEAGDRLAENNIKGLSQAITVYQRKLAAQESKAAQTVPVLSESVSTGSLSQPRTPVSVSPASRTPASVVSPVVETLVVRQTLAECLTQAGQTPLANIEPSAAGLVSPSPLFVSMDADSGTLQASPSSSSEMDSPSTPDTLAPDDTEQTVPTASPLQPVDSIDPSDSPTDAESEDDITKLVALIALTKQYQDHLKVQEQTDGVKNKLEVVNHLYTLLEDKEKSSITCIQEFARHLQLNQSILKQDRTGADYVKACLKLAAFVLTGILPGLFLIKFRGWAPSLFPPRHGAIFVEKATLELSPSVPN